MMRPSLPRALAVEVTAMTLLMQIMLPSAPPDSWRATMVEVLRPSISAVSYCRGPNRVLDTVQEPETKAPKMPMTGER